MKNAKLLLHQPLIGGAIRGPASDIEIHAKDIVDLKKRIIQLYSDRSGTPFKTFADMMERDRWVSPEEAISLGLISRIITKQSDLQL